jgi:hypothetical protein
MAVALTLVAACGHKGSSSASPDAHAPGASASPDASPALAATDAPSADASATVDAGARSAWAFGCDDTSSPLGGKSIGHTSVVFKLELSNGKKSAWKPNAKKVKGRYRGEVAAFRLAEALGIDNVPPACLRVFDASSAAAALAANDEAAKLFGAEAIVEDGKVYGAVIPWIDGLQFWPLEKEPLRSEARTWLTAGKEIPKAKLDLARQTSTLIAFDYLTGNWDRYSGANVGMDRSGSHVLYVDNDAAFMEPPPKDSVARNKALLAATDRFSRSFVERLRALDAERLAATFGIEAPGRPLLSRASVAAVVRRQRELIAAVDTKVAAHGENETLYFP